MNTEIILPSQESARQLNIAPDYAEFIQHRNSEYSDALRSLGEKFKRMGFGSGPGMDIRIRADVISQTYMNILQTIREGSNVSLALIKTMNQLGGGSGTTVEDRFDLAISASRTLLHSMGGSGGTFSLFRRDNSLNLTAGLGIYDPYKGPLKVIVDGAPKTKRLLQELKAETHKTGSSAARLSRKLDHSLNSLSNQAQGADESMGYMTKFQDDRDNATDNLDTIYTAAQNKEPLRGPVDAFAFSARNAAQSSQGAIKSNKDLGKVLQEAAASTSILSQIAALVQAHRSAEISRGVEALVHTSAPFWLFETMAHETERAQFVTTHILLKMLAYMRHGEENIPSEIMETGGRLLSPRGLKDEIIESTCIDAE